MEFLDDCEWGYDPAYVGEEERDSDAESNRPVGADDWAQGDFDGGP